MNVPQDDDIYCEDCAFYDRSIRPKGCSAPQNLKQKPYKILTTRRFTDSQKQRWTDLELLRSFGWLMARLRRACGQEARWFSVATESDKNLRKGTPATRKSG